MKVVLVVLMLAMLMSGVASATTHTVCASGCDFTTIQAAVTAAAEYDTVYVWNGTYTENVNIGTANLTLVGEGRDVVTVGPAASFTKLVTINAAYVNISGFNFTTTDLLEDGVTAFADDCNISDNIFNQVYGTWGAGTAIKLDSSSRTTIIDNLIITANSGIGVCAGCHNVTVHNNTILYAKYGGIDFSVSNDWLATNNTIVDTRDGISVRYTTDCRIEGNNISGCKRKGIYLRRTNTGTLIDNRVDALTCLQFENNLVISPSFEIENNTLLGDNGVVDGAIAGHEYRSNRFMTDNNIMCFVPEPNRTISVGNEKNFNVSIIRINRTPCSSITLNSITSSPNTTINTNVVGNEIQIQFTPTKRGIYSILLNITDDMENIVVQRFHFGEQGFLEYFIRPGVEPTHGQPASGDARAMLFTPPVGEETFYCGQWVQASPDDIPVDIYGISQIINMNVSMWYSIDTYGTLGLQRNATRDENMGCGKRISDPTDYEWIVEDINTNFWMYDNNSYIWLSMKLTGDLPQIRTYAATPSFVNFTYVYTTTPAIKAISNEDILLLSATSPAIDNTSASIVLDGDGATNLTVQMPNTAIDYNAFFDASKCNGTGNCSFTQAAGELNFTLTLGSEHGIDVQASGIYDNATFTIYPNGTFSSDQYTIGHTLQNLSISPTSTLTINVTTCTEPLKRWNESADASTYAFYTVGEGDANTTYVVNVFADANGSKMQTFRIKANSTGYIKYNTTGYGYDRWTEIKPATEAPGTLVVVAVFGAVLAGAGWVIRRWRKKN